MKLDRPIVFFDLETTGIARETCKIVEASFLRLDIDAALDPHQWPSHYVRINPTIPIEEGATLVHGISNEDVGNCPTFAEASHGIKTFIGASDLAGFNIIHFDCPILDREFREVGVDMKLHKRRLLDVQRLYHKLHPRNLTACVRQYLNRDHTDAHTADADTLATAQCLVSMLNHHSDLPQDSQDLVDYITPPDPDGIDPWGKFRFVKGVPTVNFGKYRGKSLVDVSLDHPDYLKWIIGNDFPHDVKSICKDALGGQFPCQMK